MIVGIGAYNVSLFYKDCALFLRLRFSMMVKGIISVRLVFKFKERIFFMHSTLTWLKMSK